MKFAKIYETEDGGQILAKVDFEENETEEDLLNRVIEEDALNLRKWFLESLTKKEE